MSRYWCEEGEERLLEGQNYKFQVKGQSVTPHRDYVLRELEVTRLSGEGQVSAVQFLVVNDLNECQWYIFRL